MRGMTEAGHRIWVSLVVIVVLMITVGVVVYQQVNQDVDDIPGSAGGVGAPAGDRGVVVLDDVVAAWAGAAAAGDYATAQGYMEDNAALHGIWKDQHDDFQEQIVGYQVVQRETVGQTTTAVVQFDLASNDATCITLTVDEQTQRIWIDRGYSQCPTQPY